MVIMFYNEPEIGEIVRNGDYCAKLRRYPNEAIYDGNQFGKTTNFSINEILRPGFGERKAESSHELLQLQNNALSAFHLFNNTVPRTRPILSIGDLFNRHKTYLNAVTSQSTCSSSTLEPPKFKVEKITEALQPMSSPGSESPTNSGSSNSSWPAWVYCTRYSDRPSAGPRAKKIKSRSKSLPVEKRPRTAFTNNQLQILKQEFNECRYLTEKRRITLAKELGLAEAQIKIWFQNKRAKLKRTSDTKNTLALNLIAEGLYNHAVQESTKDD